MYTPSFVDGCNKFYTLMCEMQFFLIYIQRFYSKSISCVYFCNESTKRYSNEFLILMNARNNIKTTGILEVIKNGRTMLIPSYIREMCYFLFYVLWGKNWFYASARFPWKSHSFCIELCNSVMHYVFADVNVIKTHLCVRFGSKFFSIYSFDLVIIYRFIQSCRVYMYW